MAARRVVENWRHLWGKTGQIVAVGKVGYYGFTTSEGTKKEPAFSSPFSIICDLGFTFLEIVLLLLSAGISPKTWPCSRKTQAGRRASQTGINSTSAMRVLLTDVAVDQQPDFF